MMTIFGGISASVQRERDHRESQAWAKMTATGISDEATVLSEGTDVK